jgi:hypothetical protein
MQKLNIAMIWKYVLAFLFVGIISIIGLWVLPGPLYTLLKGLPNIYKRMKEINAMYMGILDFDSPLLVNRGTYINMNGLMTNVMGQRVMNKVVKLKNNYLVESVNKWEAVSEAQAVINLKNILTDSDIPFVYVSTPSKICMYDKQLPAGIIDYSNESNAVFVNKLCEGGVDVFDLHEVLHNNGLNHYSSFFKTDHHWLPTTAFWANKEILLYLEKQGQIEFLDNFYLDINNYNIETYKDVWIGSFGKRTGRYFSGMDSAQLIYPKYETNMTVTGGGGGGGTYQKREFFIKRFLIKI